MNQTDSNASLIHLDYLDGWRGLAILFLLVGHFFHVPGINLGTVGVNLFFVLSGYLMGQLLFIKETTLPVFYRRRISRIIPAHVFFIVCVIIFFVITKRTIDWDETIGGLFFVNNYFPDKIGSSVMPFGHLWSLSVEEHSYILLSLLAIVSRRKWINSKLSIACFTMFFSATGFWYWTKYAGSELDFGKWIHTEVSAYGIFISTCLLLFFNKKKIPRLPTFVYPLLLCVGIMMHWWSVPNPIRTTIGVAILALIVNLLSNAPEVIKNALSFKPLRMMGIWSFSIYLWQQPFYLAVYKGAMSTYTAILLTFFCGIASYYLLESPVRSYINRVWGGTKRKGSSTTG